MEFVQFHPTALDMPPGGATPGADGQTFLITEAVRGEGGRLYNLSGERFMEQYDPTRLELAPRDIVARSIHAQVRQSISSLPDSHNQSIPIQFAPAAFCPFPKPSDSFRSCCFFNVDACRQL